MPSVAESASPVSSVGSSGVGGRGRGGMRPISARCDVRPGDAAGVGDAVAEAVVHECGSAAAVRVVEVVMRLRLEVQRVGD